MNAFLSAPLFAGTATPRRLRSQRASALCACEPHHAPRTAAHDAARLLAAAAMAVAVAVGSPFPARSAPVPASVLATTQATAVRRGLRVASRPPPSRDSPPPDPRAPRPSTLAATLRHRPSRTQKLLMAVAAVTGSSTFLVGAAVACIIVVQDRLVYKPSPVSRGTPRDFGFDRYAELDFRATDGVHLKGWFLHGPQRSHHTCAAPLPTLVYFHGRDKNASFRLKKAKALRDKVGCNVLLMSYRGFGDSSPQVFPTEPGMCLDAEAAMRYLDELCERGAVDKSAVWIYGESLGGAVAVHIADKYGADIRGLILENTFTSLLDMIDRTTPIFSPLKAISRNRWTNSDKVPRLRVPILFLSGLRDTFIPPAMMQRLYEIAGASPLKELAQFPDGTHNRTWMSPGYFERVRQFVDVVMQRDAAGAPLSPAPAALQ